MHFLDRDGRFAHFTAMIGSLLSILALATAAPAEPRAGARIEARATATIMRAVTLRDIRAEIDRRDPALQRPARPCAETAAPNCRLIVYDLP